MAVTIMIDSSIKHMLLSSAINDINFTIKKLQRFCFYAKQKDIYCLYDGRNNSETQRLVQNVILKLEKIKMVLVKPMMVKHPVTDKISQSSDGFVRATYVTFP